MEPEPDKLESRAKKFMRPYDFVDVKRRREEREVELRKSKRAKLVTDRRNLEKFGKQWVKVNEVFKLSYSISDLPDLLKAMRSGIEENFLFAAQGFRKILTSKINPPIQELIDEGVLPHLYEWIKKSEFTQLQYESVWTLTNIAAGNFENCRAIVDKEFIPLLIQLLNSSIEKVRIQAAWALGNLGVEAEFRDIILKNQGLSVLIKCLQNSEKISKIKTAAWSISTLCRTKPIPEYELIKDAMPALAEVIKRHHDSEVLSCSLWALSHLSEKTSEKIDDLISTGVVPRVIQLLNHELHNIKLPAIRVIGNIAEGNESQNQIIIDLNGVEALGLILELADISLLKEVVWSFSNICAGSKEQIDRVISTGCIPRLVECGYNSNKGIVKHTVWALTNATVGRPDQILYLVEAGTIQFLCSLVNESNLKIVPVVLQGLKNILRCGKENFMKVKEISDFAVIFEQCGGLFKLQQLLQSAPGSVYKFIRNMIETYFNIKPDENDNDQRIGGY